MVPRAACIVVLVLLIAACNHPGPINPAQPTPTPPAATVAAIRLTPSTGELPIGGGTLDVTIETVASISGHGVAMNVPVELTASGGELTATSVRTDRTGHAKVTWSGIQSAEITGRCGDIVGSTTVRVLTAPTPIPPGPAPPPPPAPIPAPPTPTLPATPSVTLTLTATPATVLTGETLTLSAAATTNDAAGPIRSYAWDFDGDGATDLVTPGAATSTSYSTVGSRAPRVIATSASWATAAATTTVTVNAPAAPVLSVTLTSDVDTVGQGGTVNFTATPTNLNSESIISYSWDLDGNGTADGTTIPPPHTRTFTYVTHGNYTARVTVTTSGGRTATGTKLIVVTN